MEPTDRDLMLAVRKGDFEKFGVLFDRHHQRLFEFFYRLSGDAALSEDLVQDVFLRMLKYRRSFEVTSEFRAWMYQIARRARIDRFNRRWDEATSPLSAELALSSPGSSRPDRLFEQSERAVLLQRALLELPEEKRELLVLARFQELKYEQIAFLLGLEVGVVKVRIHRAVLELREIVLRLSGEQEKCVAKKSEKAVPTT